MEWLVWLGVFLCPFRGVFVLSEASQKDETGGFGHFGAVLIVNVRGNFLIEEGLPGVGDCNFELLRAGLQKKC